VSGIDDELRTDLEKSMSWAVWKFSNVYAEEIAKNGNTPAEIVDGACGILFWAAKQTSTGKLPPGTLKRFKPDVQAAILSWQDEYSRALF